MRNNIIHPAVFACCIAGCFVQSTTALAQEAEPFALITLVGGEGAVRTESDELITMDQLLLDSQELSLEQGLRTFAGGTATILLEEYDTAIFLAPSSEIRFATPASPNSGVNFVIEIIEGTTTIIQESDNQNWLAIAALAQPNGAYVLTQGDSLIVEINEDNAGVVCKRGELAYFSGEIPAARLIDDERMLVNSPNVTIRPDERFEIGVDNARPVKSDTPPTFAVVGHDLQAFALAESSRWLARAEQGDFTPVRGAGRGAPEPLSAQLDSDLAFDQPRPVLTTTSPPTVTPALGNVLSPSQALVESGSPGTVVAGQRFRRSRILGNPGTTGTGRLTVNSAVEQLISLRRN